MSPAYPFCLDKNYKLMFNIFYPESTSLFTTSSPLDQFEIRDLLTLDVPILNNLHISLTNMVQYLIISFIIIVTMNTMTNKYMSVVYRN